MCNSITQKLKYKQSVIKFSYEYGVTKAAIKFCGCRRTIYRWRERYYQYTAIDEYTRIRYTWFTNEHSTYMSIEFVKRAVKYFL